ncbi:MAG: hypothetical protein KDD70_10120 [Bdellovibrionales bacterium]|nr:hypothetical protein [Bdellovibrionales bacterium]
MAGTQKPNPILRYRVLIEDHESCEEVSGLGGSSEDKPGSPSLPSDEVVGAEVDQFSAKLHENTVLLAIPAIRSTSERLRVLEQLAEVQEAADGQLHWIVHLSGRFKIPVQVIGMLFSCQREARANGKHFSIVLDHIEGLSDAFLVALLEKFDVTMKNQ